MLGTNQFVNAAVQLQGLARVAVVRRRCCRCQHCAAHAGPPWRAALACWMADHWAAVLLHVPALGRSSNLPTHMRCAAAVALLVCLPALRSMLPLATLCLLPSTVSCTAARCASAGPPLTRCRPAATCRPGCGRSSAAARSWRVVSPGGTASWQLSVAVHVTCSAGCGGMHHLSLDTNPAFIDELMFLGIDFLWLAPCLEPTPAPPPATGGFEYDGQNKLSPVDVAQLRGIARQIIAAGIRCIVVSGVFSPVNVRHSTCRRVSTPGSSTWPGWPEPTVHARGQLGRSSLDSLLVRTRTRSHPPPSAQPTP